MGERDPENGPIQFGAFEINPRAGELRKGGVRLKLAEQPFRILLYLASRPGELVTREELQKLLWGDNTFVDFDRGLNAAINRLREALGDSAATPRYVETVPRRGYRFIGVIRQEPAPAPVAAPAEAPRAEPPPERNYRWAYVAVLALLAGGGLWVIRERAAKPAPLLALRPLTADVGLTTTPVISRDGQLVAYASDRATSKNLDIWVHPLAAGARPIRLTTDEADEIGPDFSPDGGMIVYHSQRDGGGVYLVPALGGAERLLVRGGWAPRFSPDGRSVVYAVGGANGLVRSRIYEISVDGGTPRELAPEVPWTIFPFYSPDGSHVFFDGAEGATAAEDHELWVVPAKGGRATKTGAYGVLAAQWQVPRTRLAGLSVEVVDRRLLCTWEGQIWELDLTGPGWTAVGAARPLTSRGTLLTVRAGGGGRLATLSLQNSFHLWRLKMDWNRGIALGEMEPLPHAGGAQLFPSASADGRVFAYTQRDPGGDTVRLRNQATGNETLLVNGFIRAKVSPDGSRVAYSAIESKSVQMVAAAGGTPTTIVSEAENLPMQVRAWTRDSKKILYWVGSPIRWRLMNVDTREAADLIAHPKLDIYTAELSPDERWLAFATQDGALWNLWIAPVRDGKAAGEREWILVNKGRDERPWWSPDGNLLYTVSHRDGTRCIWAQRLDPATKRPQGEPFAVYHIHGSRVRVSMGGLLAEFGPAMTPEGMIFSLLDATGNVWLGQR